MVVPRDAVVADTSVLYAATDRADTHHAPCRDWIAGTSTPLLLPSTVLAEVCYLIDRALGPEAEAKFLDDVGTEEDSPYRLIDLVDADLRRMAELVAATPTDAWAPPTPPSWRSVNGSTWTPWPP